jgi:hypothetical protein
LCSEGVTHLLKAIVAKKQENKIDPNLKLKYEDIKVANLFPLLIRETEKLMRGLNIESKMKFHVASSSFPESSSTKLNSFSVADKK